VRRAGLGVLPLLLLLLCCGSGEAGNATSVPAWTLVVATGRGLNILTSERPRPHVLLRHRRGSHFADFRPVLSPDGRRVAFYRRARSPARTGLWVLSLRGGTPRQLARGFIDDLDWSPDGTAIAFSRGWEERQGGIFVVDSHGGPVRRVFPAGGFPRWSPDGTRLLCSCRTRLAVWVFDSDGGRPRRLTRPIGVTTGASWSPDGRLIAFGRGCYTVADDTWCELTVRDPDGGFNRTFRRTAYLSEAPPVWSSAQSLLVPFQSTNLDAIDVRTGAKKLFHRALGSIYASPRRTAFVMLLRDGHGLALLDASGRVLERRKLQIDAFSAALYRELDVHVR
jgi:Tol biopolymer transport system component